MPEGIDPHLPHVFKPRQHGSRLACELCGASQGDEIHIKTPEKPYRWQKRPGRG